jgi:hypothetical protein
MRALVSMQLCKGQKTKKGQKKGRAKNALPGFKSVNKIACDKRNQQSHPNTLNPVCGAFSTAICSKSGDTTYARSYQNHNIKQLLRLIPVVGMACADLPLDPRTKQKARANARQEPVKTTAGRE